MKLTDRVSIVLPKKLRDEIEALAAMTSENRSTLMRRLMLKGLEELKLDTGIDSYVKGRSSLEKSARMAGVSIWRFLEELTNRKIGIRYRLEDAEDETAKIVSRHQKL
jgi:predicted HTH domain antitoxin